MFSIKKLIFILFFSSLPHAVCLAMEQDLSIEEASTPKENYRAARDSLFLFLENPKNSYAEDHFVKSMKYLVLSEKESYAPAKKLWNILHSLGDLECAKTALKLTESFKKMPLSISNKKNYVFYVQINYALHNFNEG